jgi:hypothetical protein
LQKRLDALVDMRARRHRQSVVSQASSRRIYDARHFNEETRIPLAIAQFRHARFIAGLLGQQSEFAL